MGTAAVIAATSLAAAISSAVCFAKTRKILGALGLAAGPLIAVGVLDAENLPFLVPLLSGPIFLLFVFMGAAGPSRPGSWWEREARPRWKRLRASRRLTHRQQWIVTALSVAVVVVVIVVAVATGESY